MANAPSLAAVGPGFGNPVFASQRIFRNALDAMAHPGSIQVVSCDAVLPKGLVPAAGAVLLALLDPDTRLWLSDQFADGPTAAYLQFHTGTRIAARPEDADFALVAGPAELPLLALFGAGSDAHPEQSATVVLQVEALRPRPEWSLSGPGIERETPLEVGGLDESFRKQWIENRSRFPRGVDFFFACGDQLAALARTTAIRMGGD